jgi:very-short-patch-repair endonuclease
MWRLLRENFSGVHFRRQVPIRCFFADFASHSDRLVIEVDGGQHSSARDLERTQLIEAEGYQLLRFWNHEVLGNEDGVMMMIAAALHRHHPHPTLPHQGGRALRNIQWHASTM